MKALLICPAERPEVSALAEAAPLMNVGVLGKPFLHYWLEHLAVRGAKEVKILATDRPDQVRQVVGDGARWGLRVEVYPESHELNLDEACRKYRKPDSDGWLESPEDISLIDHLPGFSQQKLFEGYNDFFSAIQTWNSKKPDSMQIGMKEIQPGIWVGLHSQISPQAQLHAPCWIGENVLVKAGAEIGPLAILENGVIVENAAAISESWIGKQTYVGSLTEVKHSLAFGNTLVDFRTESVAKVPDEFLLCALRDRAMPIRFGHLFGRLTALLALAATFPFALITILKAKLAGHRALRPRRAASPQFASENSSSIVYFEFATENGLWNRWPQLWNVARGDFTWIGNRPLTPIEAGKLLNDFERLWLASPIGLISQADAEGCTDLSSDEARAHASFYSAQANWRLDCAIFFRALKRLAGRKLTAPAANEGTDFKPRTVGLDRALIR